jgi:hypothetical protein
MACSLLVSWLSHSSLTFSDDLDILDAIYDWV